MKTLPNSLMEKITPRTPDASPGEVLWGAIYAAAQAAEALCQAVKAVYRDQSLHVIEQILRDSPGVAIEGTVREQIVGLRAVRDYYNVVAEQIATGVFVEVEENVQC